MLKKKGDALHIDVFCSLYVDSIKTKSRIRLNKSKKNTKLPLITNMQKKTQKML